MNKYKYIASESTGEQITGTVNANNEDDASNKVLILGYIPSSVSELPDSQMDGNDVICPWCLHRYQAEGGDYSEDPREEECDECGKAYILYQQFDITHHTHAI